MDEVRAMLDYCCLRAFLSQMRKGVRDHEEINQHTRKEGVGVQLQEGGISIFFAHGPELPYAKMQLVDIVYKKCRLANQSVSHVGDATRCTRC